MAWELQTGAVTEGKHTPKGRHTEMVRTYLYYRLDILNFPDLEAHQVFASLIEKIGKSRNLQELHRQFKKSREILWADFREVYGI